MPENAYSTYAEMHFENRRNPLRHLCDVLGPCSEVKNFEKEMSAEAITVLVCSTREYFYLVEFAGNCSKHLRGDVF